MLPTSLALFVAASIGAAQPNPGTPAPAPEKPAAPADAQPEKKDDALKPISATPESAPVSKPVTLPNGTIIEDVLIGTGVEAKSNSAVYANYTGTLKSNGEIFDSSVGKKPVAFPLWGVIPGWREGIPGMKVGGKRKLTIPAAAAYGAREIKDQSGKVIIPANSDLVFEVELLAVLVVEDVTEGTGEVVQPRATVKAHYRGTRRGDGVEFDASRKHGSNPLEFSLAPGRHNSVIQGWNFGLPGMKVGGKRKLTIPWQMAYGEQGSGEMIPPKTDLVFEIECVAVENPTPPPAAPAPTK